ncbi:DUF429 domain-containing protein [Planotetraspora phitsanulokensis]|uniref:DUF429 domain-containing protein n=1 Tax=Planotetraspora phitsanulokensis TaxID=575192 RepID=A0A8J3UEL7_9ACTN|nr:DUF429 domain-containing protein [Planotetraspora phitsanulokensis]GII42252.1 hypothetical protein Pph01_72550 [Planotetraspora phitsanulokensis]
MLTVGVDLAAEAVRTAVAWVEWSERGARVRDVVVGADDDLIVEAVKGAAKSGIDCPLGWPDLFVSFVSAHRAGDVAVPAGLGRDWRRDLALRVTDRAVHERTGLRPLSVSADRIAHPAMRCAALLARLAGETGTVVARDGGGLVVEVYPAASLKEWGLPYRGYKRTENAEALSRVIDVLLAAAPWLSLGDHEAVCRRSDDAADAVVAALTARAAACGLVTAPAPEQAASAATEGWIAVPTASLDALR